MLHARSDYDSIQPWPVKRAHIARQDGRVVRVPIDDPDLRIDAEVQIETGRVQPVIPDDEPVALIRGQDPIGWRAVLAYCDIAEAEGVQPDLIDTLRRHAEKMREWCERVGHGLPDAPAEVLR